jgi:serine protease AprX
MHVCPRRLVRVLLLATGLIGLAASVSAQERFSKLDKALRAARLQGAHRVIIQARPGARAALKRSLQQHGDVVAAEHAEIDALTAVVHANDLAALNADPSVLSVSIDAEVTSFGAPSRRDRRGDRRPELLRDALGVSGLPFTGAGVNVAIVDSGIEPTRDLAGSIAGFWDFTQGGIATTPDDDYGHGTHVAGLIASSGVGSDREFSGIAPATRLFGFRVLDRNGRGRASDVVKALEFIVASKRSAAPGAVKIDIINLSLGHPIYEPAATDPLVRAVESAVRAGITVITAAGNHGADATGKVGYAGVTSPGNAPSAITVGAYDNNGTLRTTDDRIAAFSSRGPTWFDGFAKPDVVAPGVGLTSVAPRVCSLLDLFPQLKVRPTTGRGSYSRLSGTSMAAAVATGVASIVVQASRTANSRGPALSPNALKAVLQYTAIPLTADGQPLDALTQGTGALNGRGAVTLAVAINTSIPVGSPWLRFEPEPSTITAGVVHTWSRALLWDDAIVLGTDALRFNAALWSDNIVWGTSLESDNIVWGTAAELDNIVWGTAVWAERLVWTDRVIGLSDADNIVWGTSAGLTADNIVWGTVDGDNIVWGTWDGDNIVWGTTLVRNIVWGTFAGLDNIVWGTSVRAGTLARPGGIEGGR